MNTFISTRDTRSFAAFTINHRFPSIIESIIIGNTLDNETNVALLELKNSIPNEKLSLLRETSPLAQEINHEIVAHGYEWNNAPFLFLENYLYHKICDITHFADTGYDFFAYKKNKDVLAKLPQMNTAIQSFPTLLALPFEESLQSVIHLNLHGNTADLSQLSMVEQQKQVKLLIDDSARLGKTIKQARRIDIILDNSGEELFFDLLLVYWIVQKNNVVSINLHFKPMPYFVSDAMISDFYYLIEQLKAEKGNEAFTNCIENHVKEGRIKLLKNSFWSDGSTFDKMPDPLKEDLNRSDLLIFKGDLNYRKLVGDYYWEYTYPTKEIVNYMDTSILIVRVLKSEVVVGLAPEVIPDRDTKEWLTNGKYGIIELI